MRKLLIYGFAALVVLAFFGCGPKEKATEEVNEEIPTADECKTELTEYLTGLNTWKQGNMEATNEEMVTKFNEAAAELKTKSETWAAYGEGYTEIADLAATSATYYEASAAFMAIDQAKAPKEEVDVAFNKVTEATAAMGEVNKELGLE